MKTLIIFISICCCTQVYSQVDTTLHVLVVARYSCDRASASGEPYSVFTAEAILKKGRLTFVPTFRTKTIFGIQSNQFGASIYRGFKKSYINIATSFSTDNLFPKWNVLVDYYQNIAPGLELRIGYNHNNYTQNIESHMGILGLAYEKNRVRFQYQVYKPFDNSLSHQVGLTRLMRTADDQLQLSYTYGRDNGMTNIENTKNQISSLRLNANKQISKALHLTINSSLSEVEYEDRESIYLGYGMGLRLDLR